MVLGSKGFWIANIGSAVLVNVVDYGWGSKADVGLGRAEFYAAVTVDIALGVAGAGTGAFFVFVFLLLQPEATPAVILVLYLIGQTGFSTFIGPRVREPAVRGVTRFYNELGQGQMVPEEVGTGWGGPAVR
jgi:hypothetical protein